MREVFVVAVVNGEWRSIVVVDINREGRVVRFFWHVGFGGGDVQYPKSLFIVFELGVSGELPVIHFNLIVDKGVGSS